MKKVFAQSPETPPLFVEGTAACAATSRRKPRRTVRTAPQQIEAERKIEPSARLEFGGKTIAVWKTWEARGESERLELFRDERQGFFLAKTADADGAREVEQLNPSDALAWTIQECFKGWDLERFVREACVGYIATVEHGRSAGLSKRLGTALARNLRTVAARENRTPFEQIRTFIVQGLAEYQTVQKSRRWARKHGVADASRGVQLELATTLVEVVRTLETAPSERMLADAQLAAEELNRSLHAEVPERLAAVG